MIANDDELQTTWDRIAWFQRQAAQIRKTGRTRELPSGDLRLLG